MTQRDCYCTICYNYFSVIMQDREDPGGDIPCEECGNPVTVQLVDEEVEDE